jgi:hypothetical protein
MPLHENDMAAAARIDSVCQRFEAALRRSEEPRIDEFCLLAAPADRETLRAELARLDAAFRKQRADSGDSQSSPTTLGGGLPGVVHNGGEHVGSQSNVSAGLEPASDTPTAFGRYRITGWLGEGGFGVVYKGFDPDLRRDVAIKVPRKHLVSSPSKVDAYLNEARVLASLNHRGIVPVYDCGRTDYGLCYVVSQFMRGGDVAALIARQRPSQAEAVEIVEQVAEALHHAHQHGLGRSLFMM